MAAGTDATDYLTVGIMLSIAAGAIAGFCWAMDAKTAAVIAGGVLGWIGTVILTIGIIAKGVQVGNRSS